MQWLPKAQAYRLLHWIAFRLSTHRVVHGIWIGCWIIGEKAAHEAVLDRVQLSLNLIARYDPRRLARTRRDVQRIWATEDSWGLGHYDQSLSMCHLHAAHVTDPEVTPEDLAATVVHEATHARLAHAGCRQHGADLGRVEWVCRKQEIAFAGRLPNGTAIIERARAALDTPPADWAERWEPNEVRRRYRESQLRTLAEIGVPHWLVRLLGRLSARRAA